MRFSLWVGALALAVTLAAPCGAKAAAAEGRAPMPSEELTFSAQQRQIIRKYARGRPVKPVEVELEIGEILPEQMQLFQFHDKVVRHLPALRDYRYFIIEDEIVLVDPRDNRIVEVLDEE